MAGSSLANFMTAASLSPIRSLAYFQPVIEELLSNPAPENYLEYLRFRIRCVAGGKIIGSRNGPADVQKTTFLDDQVRQKVYVRAKGPTLQNRGRKAAENGLGIRPLPYQRRGKGQERLKP
jgi:hypothetical protein